LASKEIKDQSQLLAKFQQIKSARPTAVNLMKAVDRMQNALENSGVSSLEAEAQKIADEDSQMCLSMASHGLTILPNKTEYAFITHCNTGSLATAGLGTALGIFKLLHQQNKRIRVYATETRPYLQGARLTAWELNKCGIPITLMPDSAAAFLMKTKKIDAVFVGADRIVANGDTANKVGTYALALAARANQIPFYVVTPTTSMDLSLESGKQIEIEQRPKQELIEFNGKLIAPESIDCFNPGFDITPGELITAFITENGVKTKPNLDSLD
jgi:methylthioribose-1-phosphate isomerase